MLYLSGDSLVVRQHPLAVVGGLGEAAVGELARGLDGEIVGPDDEAYETARAVWNGLVEQYPALIVRVANAADVGRAVGFATDHDLAVSVRSAGHQQAGDAVVDEGVVVDLGELDTVEVDPEREVAVVEPGNTTADALAATQEHGLAFPTGSAGSPGVAGTTTGGGIGWIRRECGLAVDALRRVEVVTADGTVRTATASENEDLFWAVRGGGGNVGVVTEFEFDLASVGPVVGGLNVFYPRSEADAVFDAFRSFCVDAPTAATAICNYTEIPAVPGMPPEHHGEPAVGLIGCFAGDPDRGVEVFSPLREVADPLVDNTGPVPYEKLHEMGTMLHPPGRNYVHRSVYVDELTDELGETLTDRVEDAPGPLDGVGIWPLGGAVGDSPSSAFAWDDRSHLLVVEAAWESHDTPAHLRWARDTERAIRELGGEGAYAGYLGVEEQPWEDWASQAFGDNRDRLRTVKARYDPENVFGGSLSVAPATESAAD
jgi:FAD/FMN-containing dehydrogenases